MVSTSARVRRLLMSPVLPVGVSLLAVPTPKSGKRLAHDAEERESQIDAMLRRAHYHRDRARALLAKVRRAKAKAARLVKKAKARKGARARKP